MGYFFLSNYFWRKEKRNRFNPLGLGRGEEKRGKGSPSANDTFGEGGEKEKTLFSYLHGR